MGEGGVCRSNSPHLDAHSTHCPVPHFWTDESCIPEIFGLRSDPNGFSYFLEFGKDSRGLAVPFGMEIRKHIKTFFPAVICSRVSVIVAVYALFMRVGREIRTIGEPTRRLGEEEHGNSQDQARDSLHSPGNTEGRRSRDGNRAAI